MASLAHSALVAHEEWSRDLGEDGWKYHDWLQNSFKKVVCCTADETLEKLAEKFQHVWIRESTLDDQKMVLVIHPKHTGHEDLKKLHLFM